ncbi:Putatative recombinase [Desulfitobacterium hafniense]|uniref:Putatative recombinase n=1 Tax=Desulfitobacterium hafniense TaxID=49338 RepID=A0A098B7X5_DESHA|nr:Rpn family recombination-promoting nuclease/putative transposase [Desulfitobacterium hafniense]CDX04964.1 Putatative recombinase [Desulfitobacterium hafniense]
MIEGLNRINDYLFKYIFGRQESKDILLSFLNSVLSPAGEDELTDISLSDRELDPEHLKDKLSRLDILGVANDGSIINIEVQIANEKNIDKRTMFYWAKIYQSQLQSGMFYKDLARTLTINVLNFSFLPDAQRYHSMFSLYEAHSGLRLNRDLEIHFLELEKWKALSTKPRTRLDKWLMYLSNTDPEGLEEIAMSEPAIGKALTAEEIFLKNDKERYLYEMREKAMRDHLSAMDNAKTEGIERGKTEIILSMLKKGLSLKMIAEVTDLPIEQIEAIRNHQLS